MFSSLTVAVYGLLIFTKTGKRKPNKVHPSNIKKKNAENKFNPVTSELKVC